jgi:hypothetical protein
MNVVAVLGEPRRAGGLKIRRRLKICPTTAAREENDG